MTHNSGFLSHLVLPVPTVGFHHLLSPTLLGGRSIERAAGRSHLHPAWDPRQEQHEAVRIGPEKTREMIRAGALLLGTQAEGVGLVQPEEEKALRRHH